MKVYRSRASVCAGDALDAPHGKTRSFPDGTSVLEILTQVADSGCLASVAGGRATWSVASNIPLAVIAQQWPQPKPLWALALSEPMPLLDIRGDTLCIHFNYHAQQDPDVVYEVLSRLDRKAVQP
jgi:hypothetical protein